MSGRTSHYGWTTMQAGDSFSDDGYKYTSNDRIDMDNKVFLAERHHHVGGVIALTAPSGPPLLSRSLTGGLIPAGTRVYYRIALVNTTNQESVCSAEAFINTPTAVVEPNGPSLVFSSSGGALLGGDYYYALSAYTTVNTSETKALGTTFLSVNSPTGTNKITLTLPSTPSGATGFNIYRRAPGESKYFYLASVNMSGATPPTTYVDTGAVAENCDRSVPAANTTNATNSITVTYPGATPVIPVGYTWKIYRTYINGNYTKSLLTQVVSYTSEATPVITTHFTDVGLATGPGTPLTTAPTMQNPDKIILTDGAEVQGTLPPSRVAGYPETIEFSYGGTLSARTGDFVWFCEFDRAIIIGCRAVLGVGSSPASQSVIVDVNKGNSLAATPSSLSTIYTTQANRPTIAVGHQFSTRTTPNITSVTLGDMISVDVDQAGGGATPTDANLLVNIYLWVLSDHTTSALP